MPDQAKFFARLGGKIRKLRNAKGLSQEDMISFGFSARHWQQIEAGRPITVTTLLRICEVFRVSLARLLQGLDKGIYRGSNHTAEPALQSRRIEPGYQVQHRSRVPFHLL